MRGLIAFLLCAGLSGCYVAYSGHQRTDGGTTTITAAATRINASAGPAKISGSFGTPATSNAPGGQATFSRGASVLLVLGVLVAEAVNYFNAPSPDVRGANPDPQRSIAATCSCYGYKPDLTSAPPTD